MAGKLLKTLTFIGLGLDLASYSTNVNAFPESPPQGGSDNALTEIVVTAQKRSENIQDVGMAITAKSGEQLIEQNIVNVADLTRVEPSLQFSQTQSGTPVYTLRGVGYFEQSLSAAPTVSIYQDEVAYPYPVMSRGVLLDPERVEILKGPQGTLYGQNATGGAINFVAAKPTNTFEAGFDDSFGRFDHNFLTAFVSGPLSSTIRARVAFSTENGGAWQRSTTRGDDLGNKDTQIGRILLEWTPNEKLTLGLNLNGWTDHSDSQAGQLEGFRLQAPGNVTPGINLTDPASYVPAPPGSAAYNAYPAPIKSVLGQPIVTNDSRAADWFARVHPQNDESYYQAALRIDYSIVDDLGLTSLTSFQHFREANVVDQGGTEAGEETSVVRGTVKSYAEELRFHGLLDQGKINWLLGFNFSREDTNENDFVSPFISTASYSPLALGLPPFLDFGAVDNNRTITKSIFANIQYKIIDSLGFHAGVRYTKSDQDLAGCSYSTYPSVTTLQNTLSGLLGGHAPGTGVVGQCVTLGPPPNFAVGLVTNTLDQSNVPWRVGIDWTPIPNNLFYFTVSKGYKAGSSPAVGASQADQLTPVTQESLLSYEVGSKSEFLDRTLQVNSAVFHYDYTNKQELGRLLDPIYGALQALLNIPKSTENGAELSVEWRATRGLTLTGAVTYLDSKVTSDFFDTGPYPLGPTDLVNFKGEAFPFTPKWSGQLGARYQWDLGSNLTAFIAGDSSYQSRASAAFGSMEATTYGAPGLEIAPYGLLNLTVGIAPKDRHWHVDVWGKNVTNKYYWNSVNYVSDTVVRQVGMRATFGATIGYRF
jgi:outer membrane receptor protein involved in Fe transport